MDVVRTPSTGWIEVVVGSMFSGKSEELIRRLRRAQIARQRVQIFKPAVDTRYAADHIVSHSELRIPSDSARTAAELLAQVRPDTEVVGIDEGQFFDAELPAVATTLAERKAAAAKTPAKKKAAVRSFATEDEAILAYQLREKTGAELHEVIDLEVQGWDDEAQALRPDFYFEGGVRDNFSGRFEMTCLHGTLVFRRLREAGQAGKALSQEVFDALFDGFDEALRDIGKLTRR